MQFIEQSEQINKWEKILLINPNYTANGWEYLITKFPPLGLMYLASYISDINVKVKILDARAKNMSYSRIKKEITKFDADIVGISVFVSSAIDCCLEIARLVKEINPECKTVLGGRHPSFVTEETLRANCVDYIVRGEGEITFRELVINGTPINIKGVSYKSSGKIIHNPERPLMSKEDFKNIQLPARHLIKKYKYNILGMPLDAIETSRGCPFKCKFCSTATFFSQSWRPRNIESVIKELRIISQNRRVTDVYITDDNFSTNPNRAIELCKSIIKHKKNREIRDLKFFTQLRADDIVRSPKMVEYMGKAGFWVVFIGIESVNEDTLKDMEKKLSFNKIIKAVNILHANNIIVIGSLIIGLDLNATEETIRKDIRFINKIDIDLINVLSLSPFVGTEIFKDLNEKGLIVSKDWSKYTFLHPVTRTYQLSLRQIYNLIIYSFKEIKIKNKARKILNRAIKTRGILFLINPVRFLFLLKSWRKMKGLSKGFLC